MMEMSISLTASSILFSDARYKFTLNSVRVLDVRHWQLSNSGFYIKDYGFAETPEGRCRTHGEAGLRTCFLGFFHHQRQTFNPEVPIIYVSYPASAKSFCIIFIFLQRSHSFSQSTNSNNSLLSCQHGIKRYVRDSYIYSQFPTK